MLKAAKGEEEDEEEETDLPVASGSALTSDEHLDDPHGHVGMVGEMEGFEADTVKPNTESDTVPDKGIRIHMRLVQRNQMTTLALPASTTWPSDAIPPHSAPWHFLPDVLSYSRFMLATPEYMLSELRRELRELADEWEAQKTDPLGRDFVTAAREKVERQIGKVSKELMTDVVRKEEQQARTGWAEAVGGEMRQRAQRRERERRQKEREELAKQHQQSEPVEGQIPHDILDGQPSTFGVPGNNDNVPPNLAIEPNPMPAPKRNRRRGNNTQNAAPQMPPSPSYYFYQSSLGANVFLHPLDIRILLAHFKSYSLFPSTISFTSSGFDTATINDELRKRCKYLSHLPAGTEVVFVEADLEEIVGSIGLHPFEQPLKARRSKRRERVKREDRAKSRWEKSEREKMPPGTEDREFAMALQRSNVESLPTWTDPPLSSSATSSHDPALAMARAGAGAGAFSPSTSPTLAQWGSYTQPRATFAHALHTHSTSSAPRPGQRGDPQNDAEVDAAWEAFDRMNLQSKEAAPEGDAAEIPGGKKKGGKKGGKKQVLVLGGGARRGA